MSEATAERRSKQPIVVGRYALFDELAAGGMATVHLARLLVRDGPGRTVAIKRLHAQYTKDPEFCAMFLDEARLVTRIRHGNCVRTVDVVQNEDALFLVMEYVHGESLSRLMRATREKGEVITPKLVATLVHGVLLGLHAAHDVTGPDGKLLGVVHRDVSPQNVIVGIDGIPKVLDFGIAKAAGRMQTTREGQIKGKLAYMAPEQIRGQVDRRTDVFAAAIVLWEALAGRRMHEGLKDVEIVTRIVQGKFVPPSTHAPEVSAELDEIVLKGLSPDPRKRYATAKDMADDLEKRIGLVERTEIAAWVERLAKPVLDRRAAKVRAMEVASKDMRPAESAGSKTDDAVRAELDSIAVTAPPPPPQKIVVDGDHDTVALAEPPVAMPRLPTPSELLPIVTPGPIEPSPDPPSATATPTPGANDTGHSQITPSATEIPMGKPPAASAQKLDRTTFLLVAACVLLAVIGAGLGGYALAKRQIAREPAPNATALAPAPPPSAGIEAPPASSAPASALSTQLVARPTRVTRPTLGATAIVRATPDAAAPSTSASAAPSEAAEPKAAPTTTGKPSSPSPARTAATKPDKSACDPPYTVDANGEKHFKTECMGL